MFYRTDDPERDYLRYDAEQQKALERLPKCACCDEHIQQDDAVNIFNRWYCDSCLEELRESIGGY